MRGMVHIIKSFFSKKEDISVFFFIILYCYSQAKYFNFLVNEESCNNNNDNTGNYVDIVVVNKKSLANDNVARSSII